MQYLPTESFAFLLASPPLNLSPLWLQELTSGTEASLVFAPPKRRVALKKKTETGLSSLMMLQKARIITVSRPCFFVDTMNPTL